MEKSLVRRLSAILAADVVGYSRLMGEDETRTLGDLRRLRDETFAPAVADHGGQIIKGLGDGWLVSFDSAAAAVHCAASVQDSLCADAAADRVHIGDVAFEDGDIYGDGVNIAARKEALAAPGGLAISDTVYSSLDGTLRSRFTDLGPQQLKNIANPVRVWGRGGTADHVERSVDSPPGVAAAPSISIAPFVTFRRLLKKSRWPRRDRFSPLSRRSARRRCNASSSIEQRPLRRKWPRASSALGRDARCIAGPHVSSLPVILAAPRPSRLLQQPARRA